MTTELKETLQKIGENFDAFKKTNDERLKQIEQKGVDLSEYKEKLAKIDEEYKELSELKSRLEKAEIKLETQSFSHKGTDNPLAVEHKEAFEDWMRSVKMGDRTGDPKLVERLREIESKIKSDAQSRRKAVSIGAASAGGHAVPEIISRQIDQKLLDISEVLNIVNVVNVGTSDYKELVDENEAGYGWVGETGTRSETATSSLQQIAPTMGIIYAYPKATEESIQDIFFDVQSWLVNTGSQAFDQGIGAAIISGNGTNKPTGFLNGTPVAIADDGASPERAFGTLQYIPTGVAGALPSAFNLNSSPQVGSVQGDVLYDVIYALKKGYRRNARWLMNKTTLGEVRKFRDADGQYLWTPGLSTGQSDTLMGYPVSEMEDMPDVGSNTFPIAFGDFRAGYTFVNRAGMSMTIDDNITTPGYVKFYMRKRVGGILKNDDAIKVLKCAAS